MVKFRRKNWVLQVTRNMSLFHSSFNVTGNYFRPENYNLPAHGTIGIVENGRHSYVFFNPENQEEIVEKLKEICLNNRKLQTLENRILTFGENLWNASDALEYKISKSNFKNFIAAYRDATYSLAITMNIGRYLPDLLKASLKKYYPEMSEQELDVFIGDLTFPNKNTPLFDSQISLLTLGAIIQKEKMNPDDIENHRLLSKKFKEYMKKYAVIPVNFNEEPWTKEQILEQLKNVLKNNCQKEKEKILGSNTEKIKCSRKLLEKIKDKPTKQLVKALKSATYLNEYRKYVFCRASLAYRPLFREIAAKYNLASWQECWKMLPEEIIELCFNGNKKVLKKIKNRDWAGLTYDDKKNVYYFLNKKELAMFMADLKNKPAKKKTAKSIEIKGMIANKGCVRGTAKIIRGSRDFHKFQDGDIIVTAMTSVDFVPLMKRALAFVTDEGGITSHASIVSRELNKPCIIGTKIATQVLKDGDDIEVDANRGIVKILKNK